MQSQIKLNRVQTAIKAVPGLFDPRYYQGFFELGDDFRKTVDNRINLLPERMRDLSRAKVEPKQQTEKE